MAIDDILAAIAAKADQKIQQARAASKKHTTELREKHEREKHALKQSVAQQKEGRKTQLRAKVENHNAVMLKNAKLTKMQELLDRVYEETIEQVAGLSDDKLETLMKHCLKGISGKGVIHPAKNHKALLSKLIDSSMSLGDEIDAKGGFIFVSDTTEQDYTIEHLVKEILRPKTEMEISTMLF